MFFDIDEYSYIFFDELALEAIGRRELAVFAPVCVSVVPFEDRAAVVPFENRTVEVEYENRTVEVEHENRTVEVEGS